MGARRLLRSDEVCEILTSNGFQLVRQKGSHAAYQRKSDGTTRTVIVPMHREPLKPGTLASIIRQSGLPSELFETG